MIPANQSDKDLVINILAEAFDTNKSVNYIIPQHKNRTKRLRALMAYSFEMCYAFGQVLLSDDKKGCALLLFPDQKKFTLPSFGKDLQLIWSCTGLSHLPKALRREVTIKRLHPSEPILYVWFIGVRPDAQQQGTGTHLMQTIIAASEQMRRPLYLETSVAQNVSWYQRFGFEVYSELDFGYKLFCMRRR